METETYVTLVKFDDGEMKQFPVMVVYNEPRGTSRFRSGKTKNCPNYYADMEQLTKKVVLDGPVQRFRLGKTSFSNEYNPEHSYDVTEVCDWEEFDTEEKVITRVYYLKKCRGPHVVEAHCSNGIYMLLKESVKGTVATWIAEKYSSFDANKGQKWYGFIRDDLLKQFREIACGLMEIHSKGFVFDGNMDDILITADGLKFLQVIELPSKEGFDDLAREDVVSFGMFFFRCLLFPKDGNIFGRASRSGFSHDFTPNEIETLGLNDEDNLFLQHLAKYPTMEQPSLTAVFNHPMLFKTTREFERFLRTLANED